MLETYKDNYGRVDLKPVNGGVASTNNQLLYTGELAILMKLAGGYSQSDFTALSDAVYTCQLRGFPGLYSRHPEPYRQQAKFVPVSFDEILGACFMHFCAGDFAANEHILERTQLTGNRFCDVPGYETVDSLSSVFKGGLGAFYKDLIGYYKEAKTYDNLEKGFRKSVLKFPRFYPVFFSHGRSCLAMYRAGAGCDIGFLNSLAILLGCFFATLKKDNASTKVLWFFRLKFLELTGKENCLTKLAKSIYNRKCKAAELFKDYYPEGHPFHKLLNSVKEK